MTLQSLRSFFQKPDFGLLLIRIGVGSIMTIHGANMFLGGQSMLEQVGQSMRLLGFEHYFVVWGFLAALSQTVGGLCVVLGFVFRPACLALLFTMVMATWMHISHDDSFVAISHPLKLIFIFLGLLFTGPGSQSIHQN